MLNFSKIIGIIMIIINVIVILLIASVQIFGTLFS